MTTQSSRKFNVWQLITVFGVMLALLGAFYALDRVVLNPWSIGLGGQPTLTGSWKGTVDVAPGDRRNVFVHLRYHWRVTTGGNRNGWDSIKGTIEVCGPAGTVTSELSGEPANLSGSRFAVDPRNAAGPAFRLARLHGQWAGDRITVQSETYAVRADGSAYASTADQRGLVFELRRVGKAAIERAC